MERDKFDWTIKDVDRVVEHPGWRGWMYRWCLRRLAPFGEVSLN